MSPEERARVRDEASRRGLYASELVRDAIRRRPEGAGPDPVTRLTQAIRQAGREFNEAAWAANVSARRYGFVSCMKDEEYERMLGMLSSCERMARRAVGELPEARRASRDIVGREWFVVPTRRMASPDPRGVLLTARVSERDREKVERCAAREGMTPSSWVRMAVLTHIDGVGLSADPVVTTDKKVGDLMREAIRWRTNHGQAERALACVLEAKGGSRYLSRDQSDEVVRLVRRCSGEVAEAWGTVVSVLGPIEEMGPLRGVGLWR